MLECSTKVMQRDGVCLEVVEWLHAIGILSCFAVMASTKV